MTPRNSANSVFELRIPNVKCIWVFSRASTVFCPCWVPTWPHVGTSNPKRSGKIGFQRVLNKLTILNRSLVGFQTFVGSLLGSKLTPRTRQDGPQERPRTARDGFGDAPNSNYYSRPLSVCWSWSWSWPSTLPNKNLEFSVGACTKCKPVLALSHEQWHINSDWGTSREVAYQLGLGDQPLTST